MSAPYQQPYGTPQPTAMNDYPPSAASPQYAVQPQQQYPVQQQQPQSGANGAINNQLQPMQVGQTYEKKKETEWQHSLNTWSSCFSHIDAIFLTWCFPCCVSGINLCEVNDNNCCYFCRGCFCIMCTLACNSSNIEENLGGHETGCCFLCLIHYCTPLSLCLIGREYVAVKQWKAAGSPKIHKTTMQ